MSSAPNTVDETPSTVPTTIEPTAPAETALATTEAAPETTAEPTPAAATETTADTPAPVKEETVSKDDAKVEATPASEGVLGYKAPGLVKSFRFSKKFFWFSDDAVEHKHLYGYINNEKADVAHPTAAWATQSGKGLLFFAKRAEDRSAPIGIINLAEISDVTKDGFNEFFFKLGGHKHTLQAGTGAERDSWIDALKSKASEAKEMKEGMVGSEGYRSQLEKYVKPAAVVAPIAATTTSTPKKSTEDKAKDIVKKDDASGSDKEEKRKDKSRSQSRKRGSIFGTLLGKKEEHEEKEVKKEEGKEETKDTPAVEPTTVEEAAAPAAGVVAPAVVAEDKKHEETTDKTETKTAEPAAHKSKRNSIFGGFFQKKDVTSPTAEKTKEEAAPAVPAKDTETPAVAETAPQIEAPVDTGKPIEPESVTQPIDTPAPKETTPAPQETGTSPSKGGLIGFFKKAENLFEEKKEAKTEAKAEDKVEKKADKPAAPATTTDTPAPATTETSPTPADTVPLKEKRRTSLFGSLGTKKKDKTADKETSDAEVTDGETKHKTTPTSPLPKLSGIFRKPSKAVKPTSKDTAPAAETTDKKPEPISKEEPSETAAPMTNGDGHNETIGDVVPEAVNVGSTSTPVQAAA